MHSYSFASPLNGVICVSICTCRQRKSDPCKETCSESFQVHYRLTRYMGSCDGKQGYCGRTNVSLFYNEKNDHQNNVTGHNTINVHIYFHKIFSEVYSRRPCVCVRA